MSLSNYAIHGIYIGFNRQMLESRGRLEDEGTKRTTTLVLNIVWYNIV